MQPRINISFLTNRLSRNIAFWLLFTALLHSSRGIFFPNYVALLLAMFISYAPAGYVNNLWLIPKFLFKRRYLFYVVLFIPLIALTTALSYFITQWANALVPSLDYMDASKSVAMIYHLYPSLLMLSFMAFGKFMADAIQGQKKMEVLEKEKLKNELESLRAQINPHFLFNSLNTIYGMARRNNANTADAVIKLSDILRHGLYQCNEDDIPVDKELHFLRQYIEFAKLRVHDKNSINLDIHAEINQQKIAPLLLIPFVENAIKHGIGKNAGNSWVKIGFVLTGNQLSFLCSNSNFAAQKEEEQTSYSGIGLKNVKRRLELLYAGKHELTISNAPDHYTISLNLQLS